jgi:uncharacterized membrane protein
MSAIDPQAGAMPPDQADARSVNQIFRRVYEVALVALGLVFIIGDDLAQRIWYLALWDIGASIYLIYGMWSVRRIALTSESDLENAKVAPKSQRVRSLYFFNEHTIFSTFASSITGVAAAISIVFYRDKGDLNHLFEVLAVVAMICAWMMLHAGYARLYQHLSYDVEPAGGLQFPDNVQPNFSDFIYFAFTLGATFAVSDVNITSRQMRWYVTVHSVISFFYNSAVLALAVGIITGP